MQGAEEKAAQGLSWGCSIYTQEGHVKAEQYGLIARTA